MSSHSVKRRSVARPATAARVRPTAKSPVVATARPAQSKRPLSVSSRSDSPSLTSPMTAALVVASGPFTANAETIREKAQVQRNRFLDSLESVQGKNHDAKAHPRWFKVLTWFLVLMPLYAIIIYGVGYLYFHANENVGLQTSFQITPVAVTGNVLVPDQNGAFLQTGAGATAKQTLNLINEFPDRSLQPPSSAQVVLKSTALHYVLVRDAQVYLPADYPVYRIQNGKPDVLVNVTAVRLNVPGVAVIAISMPNGQAWAPGEYMLNIPIPDDEGDTYSFFTIQN